MVHHNDPQHLDRLMSRAGPGLVAVDSVNSTTAAARPAASADRRADMGYPIQQVAEQIIAMEAGPAARRQRGPTQLS